MASFKSLGGLVRDIDAFCSGECGWIRICEDLGEGYDLFLKVGMQAGLCGVDGRCGDGVMPWDVLGVLLFYYLLRDDDKVTLLTFDKVAVRMRQARRAKALAASSQVGGEGEGRGYRKDRG